MSAHGASRHIPNTYQVVPPGFTEDTATEIDLRAAGFEVPDLGTNEPGQQPLDEMLVEGTAGEVSPDVAKEVLRQVTLRVLRAPTGEIVATWDEGRWWTPDESAEFVRQLVAELRQGR